MTDTILPEDIPGQTQDAMPADEYKMDPAPDYEPRYPGVGKLKDKVAIITGGDSGIGRAISVLFAREGAKVVISYLNEDKDAQKTKELVEKEGSQALLIEGDTAQKSHCETIVSKTMDAFGRIDILINNAAQQWMDKDFAELSEDKMDRMLDSNVKGYMLMTQAVLPHLKEGSSIINTTSINAFHGHGGLITYTVTRGASVAFSRALSANLADKKIRVNSVAPGPIWTPFIPGTLPEDAVEGFGSGVPLSRPGQPWEVATSYLFLASEDGSYFTGQTLHPNGGTIING